MSDRMKKRHKVIINRECPQEEADKVIEFFNSMGWKDDVDYVNFKVIKNPVVATKEDKELVCVQCDNKFVFTVGEQLFFEEKEFADPHRCPSCRASRRESKQASNV